MHVIFLCESCHTGHGTFRVVHVNGESHSGTSMYRFLFHVGPIKRRHISVYAYLCHVWIRILCINSIIVLDVLEGVVHQSTIAALVSPLLGAVHQILLT